MPGLPIVKMTLYKHGVGFFTRHGNQPGDTVALAFRTEDMNDVLKSLTTVATRGQVLGVDYQTPEDKAELLKRSSIQLSDDASLRDLLADMRGRQAQILTAQSRFQGIVAGVDLPGEREPMSATLVSLYLPETRELAPVRLGDIQRLVLDDDRAAADLAYFLETSLTEEDKRAVTVRLSPGAEAVSVSYIAPSPVWRVSYRLVADDVEHPERSASRGTPRRRRTSLPACCRAGRCSTTRSTRTWKTSRSRLSPGCRSASSTTSTPRSRPTARLSRKRAGASPRRWSSRRR